MHAKKQENRRSGYFSWRLVGTLVALALTALLFVLLSLRYDFYYDLNDDYLIGHIVSGAYTGEPEIRDIQNLFPFSALAAGLQRLFGGIDWYALLLMVLQFVSVWIIVDRASRTVAGNAAKDGRRIKPTVTMATGRAVPGSAANDTSDSAWTAALYLLCGAATLLLLAVQIVYHLVFVQYSVTVGLLSAAVIAIIMTVQPAQVCDNEGRLRISKVLRQLAGAFALVFTGFALRSEMLLFCSPFIALAALYRGVEMFYEAEEKRVGKQQAGWKGSGERVENQTQEIGKKQRIEKTQPHRARKKPGRFGNLVCWLLTIGVVCVLGMGVLKGIDLAGYSAPAWQKFENFFDARTQLYDFQWTWMKHYDEDPAFYDSIGMDRSEVELLWNYNFGLDSAIDENKVAQIADHAAALAAQSEPTGERIRNAVAAYRTRLRDSSERPWNMIAPFLYLLVIVSSLIRLTWSWRMRKAARENTGEAQNRNSGLAIFIWRMIGLLVLFAGRSALFLYLLYNNRPVVRLTHCLYLLEAVILWFLFLEDLRWGDERRRTAIRTAGMTDIRMTDAGMTKAQMTDAGMTKAQMTDAGITETGMKDTDMADAPASVLPLPALAIVLLLLFFFLPPQLRSTTAEYERREEINVSWQEYMNYVQEHPETFYCTDVYSTVAYSEKMFAKGEARPVNWDIAGGWACKSPLWEKKLARFDIHSLEEALPDAGNVYFVSSPARELDWLTSYYAFRGKKVRVEQTEQVNEAFCVYRVVTDVTD